MSFNCSRRSVVHSSKGIVSCSQPLAAAAGIKILGLGGNSIDASIAVSACLCVLEPASTGVAGDCFLLHFDSKTNKVLGLNGTGRTPSKITYERLLESGVIDSNSCRLPFNSVHAVTVPGAIAGWIDAFTELGSGRVTLEQIFQPAIELCENGHPVSEISAFLTQSSWKKLEAQNLNNKELISCFASVGRPDMPPLDGDFVKNPKLGELLRGVAKYGKDGFYAGPVAEAITEEVQARGGFLTKEDLANHTSTFVDPIYLDFLGHRIWQIPPNGQGLVVLLALGIIRELHEDGTVDLYQLKHNSTEYLHLIIECLKIAFYDADEYVSDPEHQEVDILPKLLSKPYLKMRARLFNKSSILDSKSMSHGVPNSQLNQSDTVYFTVSDPEGNATSFINSVYVDFGSGIVPRNFGGFALQNRGANLNLTKGSKNFLEPNKRAYHTIIPTMITNSETGELVFSLGNMGGFMQPTGHVQHFFNLLLFNLSPQQSLDSPRVCLSPHPKYSHLDRGRGSDGPVSTPVTLISAEDDLDLGTIDGLRALGHDVDVRSGMARTLFGRGQIIKKRRLSQGKGFVYSAGSDKRGDGCAIPLI
ncbi:LADA_0E14950g1_1 [Lachancea dasiensis]|uniref:LADA_0E14950g1_1 n=1 Tax=Lachancea dasiensis TaxID=1072105 RepID=A0A1G4JGT9_9SACH|nr:LADA_0E14950g1_1 [Lachancea dasiensis]